MTLSKQILSGKITQTRAGIEDNRGLTRMGGKLVSGTVLVGGFVKRDTEMNFVPATSTDLLIYYVDSVSFNSNIVDSANPNNNSLELVDIRFATPGISQIGAPVGEGIYLMIDNATTKLIPWTAGNVKVAISIQSGIENDFIKVKYIEPTL